MKKALKAIATADKTIHDYLTLVMEFVNQRVKMFLRLNPQHDYLKDDIQSSGYLCVTEVLSELPSNPSRATTGYLKQRLHTAFLICVHLEQTIITPTTSDYIGTRELLSDYPCDSWLERAEELEQMELVATLPEREQQYLSRALAGYSKKDIQEDLHLTVRQLNLTQAAIQKRFKDHV